MHTDFSLAILVPACIQCVGMSSPTPVKRARANHDLSVASYAEIAMKWLKDYHQDRPFDLALGPLVTKVSSVTRDGLMRALPLLDLLVDAGAQHMVILGHVFEGAMAVVFSRRPSLVGSLGRFAGHDIVNHLMVLCKVVRVLKRERNSSMAGSMAGKTSKVGPLKKGCSSADWIAISMLLEKIVLPDQEPME
eukprot:10696681-Lingulodinium_polyedra.AAC.1